MVPWRRLTGVAAIFAVGFSLLYMRIYTIGGQQEILQAGNRQGSYTLRFGRSMGVIYDCKGNRLNCLETKYQAAMAPTPENVLAISPWVADREDFAQKVSQGLPFVCEVTTPESPLPGEIVIFEEMVRNSKDQLAVQVLGYGNQDGPVSGLEYACQDILSKYMQTGKATFSIDGTGRSLQGEGLRLQLPGSGSGGVITALDAEIQRICEQAAEASGMKKGAIVVMEPATGNLRAVVSMPDFNPVDVAASLEDPDSPFINRAFSAYSVGSVFKLVTAAVALENGISPEYQAECKGHVDLFGQIFRCHYLAGHGVLNMTEAMAESCNPYFIELSRKISPADFLARAYAMGFGKGAMFGNGLYAARGNMPSAEALKNTAELANLSFGQGLLTATPLQVAMMTCAIANLGQMAEPVLILGETADGRSVLDDGSYSGIHKAAGVQAYSDAVDAVTAYTLREMMTSAIQGSTASAGLPSNVTAGGKTSTAQTGRFDEEGKEYMNAWFTGFFPADEPQYVVTVLIEDGVSGNQSAGPVFKEIAENITRLR